MTIEAVLDAVDQLVPNAFSFEEKVAWLSALDGTVKAEIIDTHEPDEAFVYMGPYTEDMNPEDVVLLASEPYAYDLYIKYLQCQMDYFNGESKRYNNSLAAFEAAYTAFARWYHRTHLPISKKRKYW